MVIVKKYTHFKIAASWIGIISGGIYLFILAKRSIEKERYENMKIRQRMKSTFYVEDNTEE